MNLIVQPDAGVAPILTAIKRAKKTIDVLIFRLDRTDIARALEAAVARGVSVRALTAHTNRGGEKHLRRLELHLLEQGVTVSRTADDLVRYHGKLMIVDGRTLHLYGFNFTTLDIEKSRSFGVVTTNQRLVQEAVKLFAADFDRQAYTPGFKGLIVSPETSRQRLAEFLNGAKRQLLIYDPGLTDDAMLRIITARIKAGVDVKIIGKVEAKWDLASEKYPGRRLHVRAIVRDGQRAFVGSQSLRKLELDKRREVGMIITDRKTVEGIMTVFARDWAETPTGKKAVKKTLKSMKDGKPLRPEDKLLAAAAS
ncbi:MAG TPA: phospholipase D-like domain-containing protein [Vicinamibacterales bacterium]|nr:phospholipase D-like domain-containing protein [Vicinamibacterales bacterium]